MDKIRKVQLFFFIGICLLINKTNRHFYKFFLLSKSPAIVVSFRLFQQPSTPISPLIKYHLFSYPLLPTSIHDPIRNRPRSLDPGPFATYFR